MVTPRVVRAGPFPASHPCVERTTAGSTRLPEILRTFFRQGTTSTFGTGRHHQHLHGAPGTAPRARSAPACRHRAGRPHRHGRHTQACPPRTETSPPRPATAAIAVR